MKTLKHENIKTLKRILLLCSCVLVLFCFNEIGPVQGVDNEFLEEDDEFTPEIEEIRVQIELQNKKIKEIEEQKKLYEEKIEIKREEAVTLKNQLDILASQITKRRLEIEKKESEIKATDLSIKNIQFKILEKQSQITKQKADIAEFLRAINQYDNKSPLEIIFLHNSISEVLNQLEHLDSIQASLAYSLKKIELIKEALEVQEKDLRIKMKELIDLKDELADEKTQLVGENQAKQNVLEETRGAEWKFQALLAEAVKEHRKIENEIVYLEKEVREKIAQKEREEKIAKMEAEGEIIFSWSVPSQIITCEFHDPEYPYKKWIGEHSGIDIRAPQGTAVRAAASGYVARARHGGMGYSYVMIIHNDRFSSLYGHLSEILVEEDEYITRGEIIGRSGGLPGTPGAGRFSTGPHLHFEVRSNGIPINPMDYLL